MHIKQVTINGFRTYKNQVEVAPFSEHHNCVVGRNGSGKSNFFDAIRFALMNGRFTSLMQAERQQLLYEGSRGANVACCHFFCSCFIKSAQIAGIHSCLNRGGDFGAQWSEEVTALDCTTATFSCLTGIDNRPMGGY